MILVWLVLLPFIAGVLAWIADRWSQAWPRWIALAGIAGDLALATAFWIRSGSAVPPAGGPWLADIRLPWIGAFGIQFHLGLDGLSLLLVLLTGFLTPISILSTWTAVEERVKDFMIFFLLLEIGMMGV